MRSVAARAISALGVFGVVASSACSLFVSSDGYVGTGVDASTIGDVDGTALDGTSSGGDANAGDGSGRDSSTDAGSGPPEPALLVDLAEGTAARPAGAAQVSSAGDFVVVGRDNVNAVAADGLVLRADPLGTVTWAKRIGGSFEDLFIAVAVVGTTVHAFGTTRTVYNGSTRNTDVLWTQLDAANGDVLSSRHFGGPDADAIAAASPATNGVLTIASDPTTTYIRKLLPNGTAEWGTGWSTDGTDTLRTIRQGATAVIAAGSSTVTAGAQIQPVIVTLGNSGSHQWSRRITNLPDSASFHTVAEVADGIVAAGFMKTSAASSRSPFALKLTDDGATVLWAKRYTAPGDAAWTSMVIVPPDVANGVGETMVVGGGVGSDIAMTRISLDDGSVIATAAVASPSGAVFDSDREMLWRRPDQGFGMVFLAQPSGSAITTLGVVLPNRLLGLPAGCTSAKTVTIGTADLLGLVSATFTPNLSLAAFGSTVTGTAIATTDVAFTRTKSCE